MFSNLPKQKFDVLLIDPPWTYHGQQDKWGAAAKFYDTVPDADLSKLPVLDLCNKPSVVFVWATGPRLDAAINVIKDWGLFYRGLAFVWVKTSKVTGLPIGAQGVRPSVVKPLTELVLVASTVAKGRPLPLASESIVQTVFAPRREHSHKPDEVQDRIDLMYPNATKLELFARRKRSGWESWGNEIGDEPL